MTESKNGWSLKGGKQSLYDFWIWGRYDLATSFKSPILEGLLFILFAGILVPSLLLIQEFWFPFVIGSNENNNDLIEAIEIFSEEFSTSLLFVSMHSATQLIIFIIPMLLSLSFTQILEDGSIRTLLSYPITRSHLLIGKFAFPVFLTGIISSICSLGINILLIPMGKNVEVFILAEVFLWLSISLVAVSMILISILTRNAILALVIGSGVWFFGISFVAPNLNMSFLLRGLCNPMTILSEYASQSVLGPTIFDIQILLTLFTLSVLLLSFISYILFRRLEV